MARYNGKQEAKELAKQKPKVREAIKRQKEFEKDKIWEPVPNSFGNLMRLVI